MAEDTAFPAARFARTLLATSLPGGGIERETAGFGASEALAESVAPAVESLIPARLPEGFSQDEVTAVAHKLLAADALNPRETYVTEAIIIPDLRPALIVHEDDFAIAHPAWPDYVTGTPAHANFCKALRSVGRIELIGNPAVPYGGTGFVVAPDLVMTNRHVAALFAAGIGTGNLRFQEQMGAAIDFEREHGMPPGGTPFAVREVVMIHPYWDLALLRVEGLEDRTPLTFAAYEPDFGNPRRIAAIGYPAFDPRNDAAVQDQVFGGVYNVKRLQPGLFNGRRGIDSYGKPVQAGTHDSSTLGGNSGSALIEAAGGKVVGLHFAGIYKDSNFAVPASDLARDGRMRDAGLRFEPASDTGEGPWDPFWATATSAGSERGMTGGISAQGVQTMTNGQDRIIRVTLPLEIELSIGVAGARLAGFGVGARASANIGTGELTETMATIRAMGLTEVVTEAPAVGHGRFEGLPLRVEFNTDEDNRRWAKLLAPLTYVQPDGDEWLAPQDSWLDGASIPRPFWSVIGGPFEGLYLEASVVHDYYCDHHVRPWRDVHRMFHDAMLCRGVSGFKARIMYYAVYRFGPRWDMVEGTLSLAAPVEPLTDAEARSILADAETLAREDLSLEAIEALADKSAGEAKLHV